VKETLVSKRGGNILLSFLTKTKRGGGAFSHGATELVGRGGGSGGKGRDRVSYERGMESVLHLEL